MGNHLLNSYYSRLSTRLSEVEKAKLPTGLWKLIGEIIKAPHKQPSSPKMMDIHCCEWTSFHTPSPSQCFHSTWVLALENLSLLQTTPVSCHITGSQCTHQDSSIDTRKSIKVPESQYRHQKASTHTRKASLGNEKKQWRENDQEMSSRVLRYSITYYQIWGSFCENSQFIMGLWEVQMTTWDLWLVSEVKGIPVGLSS